jgi:FKBP-type peptidyl-prolyl cis-trans isomerase
MEAENGKRVKIRFQCRLPNGRVYQVGESNTLQFAVGALKVPATLEMGVIGMSPGDTRSIRVPAAEVELFPFPKGSHFALDKKTPPGIAYEFGPGEGGDVSQYIPAGEGKRFREPLPAGTDVIFEVEMLAVEDNS